MSDFTKRWPYAPPRGRGRSGGRSAESLALVEEALRSAPLFREIPRRHLRSIARVTLSSSHPAGRTIVQEGSEGSAMYVLLEGEARVVRKGRTVARLGPGDFFGEISLIDGGPRSASVVADSPIRSLKLEGQAFRKVVTEEPALALRVMQVLAARLRDAEKPPA
jgi:CRP/FNR family transcriptional regulator, cyclic AMP receptor protein